jgi:hypothetical protein
MRKTDPGHFWVPNGKQVIELCHLNVSVSPLNEIRDLYTSIACMYNPPLACARTAFPFIIVSLRTVIGLRQNPTRNVNGDSHRRMTRHGFLARFAGDWWTSIWLVHSLLSRVVVT